MRNWIIGAAAILALAVPGVAAAQTGYVGVEYGNVDAGGGDEDFYGVEGAVAFAGSGSIVFELNASLTDADDSDTGYGLVGHVYNRNDNYLFGGFVGISGNDDDDAYIVGLEANKYYTNWTLAGAVYYAEADDADVDGYGVNVEGRFFINDNFRLDASAGWANVEFAGNDDDAVQLGVGAEYQLAAAPISVRAGYSNTDFDNGDIDTWSIGLRYNWGGTLRDRDRNGASQASLVGLGGLF
jgi:hypothetical protein